MATLASSGKTTGSTTVLSLRSRRRRRLVSEALTQRGWITDIHGTLNPAATIEYVELWRLLHSIVLSDEPDKLSWKWTIDGTYTARSAYHALFHGAITASHWQLIWKTWAPSYTKIFLWLVSLNRCWTADRRARHGLPHDPICKLCDQENETPHHLLVGCAFSRIIWHDILAWCRTPALPPDGTTGLFDWWTAAINNSPACLRKGLSSVIILTTWAIWKHRNAALFDNVTPSCNKLLDDIKQEAALWARAGAKGLDRIIGVT